MLQTELVPPTHTPPPHARPLSFVLQPNCSQLNPTPDTPGPQLPKSQPAHYFTRTLANLERQGTPRQRNKIIVVERHESAAPSSGSGADRPRQWHFQTINISLLTIITTWCLLLEKCSVARDAHALFCMFQRPAILNATMTIKQCPAREQTGGSRDWLYIFFI